MVNTASEAEITLLVLIGFVMILLLLFMALGSLRYSLLVLIDLPFALVGGVIAVVLFLPQGAYPALLRLARRRSA